MIHFPFASFLLNETAVGLSDIVPESQSVAISGQDKMIEDVAGIPYFFRLSTEYEISVRLFGDRRELTSGSLTLYDEQGQPVMMLAHAAVRIVYSEKDRTTLLNFSMMQ